MPTTVAQSGPALTRLRASKPMQIQMDDRCRRQFGYSYLLSVVRFVIRSNRCAQSGTGQPDSRQITPDSKDTNGGSATTSQQAIHPFKPTPPL